MRLLPIATTMLTAAATSLWTVAVAGIWTSPIPDRAMPVDRAGAAATSVMAVICWALGALRDRDRCQRERERDERERGRERERALIRVIDQGLGGGHPSGPLRAVR